jgi:hypothetical protein
LLPPPLLLREDRKLRPSPSRFFPSLDVEPVIAFPVDHADCYPAPTSGSAPFSLLASTFSPRDAALRIRSDTGLSFENYNPAVRRDFTEPLTLQALKTLDVTSDEFFYPTNRDLYLHTRDSDIYESIRSELIDQLHRTRPAVADEVDRLARRDAVRRSDSVSLASYDEQFILSILKHVLLVGSCSRI